MATNALPACPRPALGPTPLPAGDQHCLGWLSRRTGCASGKAGATVHTPTRSSSRWPPSQGPRFLPGSVLCPCQRPCWNLHPQTHPRAGPCLCLLLVQLSSWVSAQRPGMNLGTHRMDTVDKEPQAPSLFTWGIETAGPLHIAPLTGHPTAGTRPRTGHRSSGERCTPAGTAPVTAAVVEITPCRNTQASGQNMVRLHGRT